MEMIKEFIDIGLKFLQIEVHVGSVSFSYWNIIIFTWKIFIIYCKYGFYGIFLNFSISILLLR